MKKFFTYDAHLYNELLKKKFENKELTPEEEEYITRCYHWEEEMAGIL